MGKQGVKMTYDIQLFFRIPGGAVQLRPDPADYADGTCVSGVVTGVQGAVWRTSGSHEPVYEE